MCSDYGLRTSKKGCVMTLKNEFSRFVQDKLKIPLIGVAPPDDHSQEDVERISFVVKTFAKSTPIAAGNDTVLQPKDFLPEARSVIVAGTPSYLGKIAGFEECRQELLGRAELSHVNVKFLQDTAEKSYRITDFFTSRGFQCFPLVGGQFPIKLMASKCGVGYYGKNAIIQHPAFGSWISLSAYITDAELEPDDPLDGDCDKCELCLSACPSGAIFAPYRCDVTRCIDFNLGHNKRNIPLDIREKCSNLMGEGCTACRDICPKNRKLKPIEGFETCKELLHPSLLKVFDMTDDEWENGFATTLMGFFLIEKKYLQRNAAIGLGNFKDERALDVLVQVLETGDDEIRGYVAWAIGSIGGAKAVKHLHSSLDKEKNERIKEEFELALAAAQ
jgi:epoxyqueuosine reductase QueG